VWLKHRMYRFLGAALGRHKRLLFPFLTGLKRLDGRVQVGLDEPRHRLRADACEDRVARGSGGEDAVCVGRQRRVTGDDGAGGVEDGGRFQVDGK
jgi:hypothetical protein